MLHLECINHNALRVCVRVVSSPDSWKPSPLKHLSLNGPEPDMTATTPHSHGEEERPPLLPLGKVAAQRDTVTQKLVGHALGSRQQ